VETEDIYPSRGEGGSGLDGDRSYLPLKGGRRITTLWRKIPFSPSREKEGNNR
jgi:hypothetical protein